MQRRVLVFVGLLLLGLVGVSPAVVAGPPAQQAGCLFFTETGGGHGGYSVCDDGQARFRGAFERWGPQRIGYPISRRHQRDGFVTQAFQKAIMQWRPETGSVALVNIFDDLHNAGFDARLLQARQTPNQLPAGWDGTGLTFEQVVRKRQALLNSRPALRNAYFAVGDPLTFFGLPTSEVQDMGNHYAIRLQRTVLQEWKEDVPWARTGMVTIANGGDIARELGGLPAEALEPEQAAPPAPPVPAPAIAVPAGFSVSVYATLDGAATSLAFDSARNVLYVTMLDGRVLALRDTGPGSASNSRTTFAANLVHPLGLAVQPGSGHVYVGRRGGVDRLVDTTGDGVADTRDKVVDGLPAGRHDTDDVEFGPDGRLYIGQGSVDDMGESGSNPQLQAGILRANPDGSGLEKYASGLRNPYGLAFDAAGHLWATDNGGDAPDGQSDELNRIEQGGFYGWPRCSGRAGGNCSGVILPVAELASHSSSNGLAFWPAVGGDAIIAQWGNTYGDRPVGRVLVRVNPATGSVSQLASGFAHPIAVLVDPRDGDLWAVDFGPSSGRGPSVLYKISPPR
ncbi:MAG TPA: PQQ-dependent sugar dehydrogenase [Ardenticatenaceae bacterium]|nr:PQQ-dependent sugar dehydrogenase [Ardenticatenaceae bacterium]